MKSSKQHPCRKLVLNELDKEIFNILGTNQPIDFVQLVEMLRVNSSKLKKRLTQLKKHKYIKYHKDYSNILLNHDLDAS